MTRLRASVTAIAIFVAIWSVAASAQQVVRIFGTDADGASAPVTVTAGAIVGGIHNSFASQNATGQTAALDTGVVDDHSVQLVVTGSPAGCTYDLEGSNDNTNWFDITASAVTCTATTQSFEADKPARYVRGDLVTLSGGTSPTVTLHYAGK